MHLSRSNPTRDLAKARADEVVLLTLSLRPEVMLVLWEKWQPKRQICTCDVVFEDLSNGWIRVEVVRGALSGPLDVLHSRHRYVASLRVCSSGLCAYNADSCM